jgi:sulfur-oxidizing protein SoxY
MTTRRSLLALALLPAKAAATTTDGALAAAIRDAVGDAAITDGGITLRAPATAENGGQVPITVLVDSPMTAADHVTAIHVFATANPTPGVVSFRLTPLLARAEVQTRIRLAEAQRVIVLAQTNDGRVRRTVAEIRVTTGGCLT